MVSHFREIFLIEQLLRTDICIEKKSQDLVTKMNGRHVLCAQKIVYSRETSLSRKLLFEKRLKIFLLRSQFLGRVPARTESWANSGHVLARHIGGNEGSGRMASDCVCRGRKRRGAGRMTILFQLLNDEISDIELLRILN